MELRTHNDLNESENRAQCLLFEPFMKKNLQLVKNDCKYSLPTDICEDEFTSMKFKQLQAKLNKYNSDLWTKTNKPYNHYLQSLIYKNNTKSKKTIFDLTHYRNIENETVNGIPMISLYEALDEFQSISNVQLKFVQSQVGDTLKVFKKEKILSYNVLKKVNCFNNQTIYPLLYGLVPAKKVLDLECMVMHIITHLNETAPDREYDFLEGELETLLLEYWRLHSQDLKMFDKSKLKSFHEQSNAIFRYTCFQLFNLNESMKDQKNSSSIRNNIVAPLSKHMAKIHPEENIQHCTYCTYDCTYIGIVRFTLVGNLHVPGVCRKIVIAGR